MKYQKTFKSTQGKRKGSFEIITIKAYASGEIGIYRKNSWGTPDHNSFITTEELGIINELVKKHKKTDSGGAE